MYTGSDSGLESGHSLSPQLISTFCTLIYYYFINVNPEILYKFNTFTTKITNNLRQRAPLSRVVS